MAHSVSAFKAMHHHCKYDKRNTVEFNDTVTGRTGVDDHTQIYECQLQFLRVSKENKTSLC